MGAVKQYWLENMPLEHLVDEHLQEVEDTYYDLVEDCEGKGEWEVKWSSEFSTCEECRGQVVPKQLIFWHTEARKAIHGDCICDDDCD